MEAKARLLKNQHFCAAFGVRTFVVLRRETGHESERGDIKGQVSICMVNARVLRLSVWSVKLWLSEVYFCLGYFTFSVVTFLLHFTDSEGLEANLNI